MASESSTIRELGHAIAGEPVEFDMEDPGELLALTDWHGITALLDCRIRQGLVTGLPTALRALLHEETLHQAALDAALNAATARIAGELGCAGIDFLLLKGSALAHRVYPSSWQRPRSDSDIWIRRADADKVVSQLDREGYRLENVDLGARSRRQFQATRGSFQERALWFDIHLDISNRALFRHALEFEACLQRAQPLSDTGGWAPGAAILAPAAPELLLHAMLHRVAHGRNSRNDRLIWLYDIHLLHGGMDERESGEFTHMALEKKLGCLAADALVTCREVFGAGADAKLLDQLRSNQASEPSAKLLQSGRWRWAWSDFRGQEGLREKWRFALELVENQRNRARLSAARQS